jgi:hypothetical protein
VIKRPVGLVLPPPRGSKTTPSAYPILDNGRITVEASSSVSPGPLAMSTKRLPTRSGCGMVCGAIAETSARTGWGVLRWTRYRRLRLRRERCEPARQPAGAEPCAVRLVSDLAVQREAEGG